MVPVTQPAHHRDYGDGVVRAVGAELGERYDPLGEYAAAGIPIALSSDAPVSLPQPLAAIGAAVDRRTVSGVVLGGPELRLDVQAALWGHTLGAAYSIHRDHAVGSLETGKLADLAVLSADPTTVPVDQIGGITVLETWLGGEQVV